MRMEKHILWHVTALHLALAVSLTAPKMKRLTALTGYTAVFPSSVAQAHLH